MPDFMDQAKNLASEHSDLVDKALDQVEHEAENRTGGKYNDQLQQGEDKLEGFLGVDPNNQQN
jgi:MT0933-like antitoxin protein